MNYFDKRTDEFIIVVLRSKLNVPWKMSTFTPRTRESMRLKGLPPPTDLVTPNRPHGNDVMTNKNEDPNAAGDVALNPIDIPCGDGDSMKTKPSTSGGKLPEDKASAMKALREIKAEKRRLELKAELIKTSLGLDKNDDENSIKVDDNDIPTGNYYGLSDDHDDI